MTRHLKRTIGNKNHHFGPLNILPLVRAEMSADRAKPGSRPRTDRLFRVLDRVPVRVTVLKSEPDPGSPNLHC